MNASDVRTSRELHAAAEMDDAADEAAEALAHVLASASPAERRGMTSVIAWYRQSVPTAGYKRLGKIIRGAAS